MISDSFKQMPLFSIVPDDDLSQDCSKKSKQIIIPKYSWKINGSLPILDNHSKVKHEIIEEYIQQYVLTLMLQFTIPEIKLSIVDGFCGGGCYQTEAGDIVDGSPLLAMRAVKTARALVNLTSKNERKVNVNYSFIDILNDNTEYLKFLLKAKQEENEIDNNDFERTSVINGSFLEELPKVIKKIKDLKGGERAIFILDQYSYKDVPMPAISSILNQLKNSEIILTFNIDNLITYLSNRAENKKAIANINLDDYIPWNELSKIKLENRKEWRQILQRYLAYGIRKESGAKFMTLFFVKPYGENSWGYWLVHLSNNYRAHDVMKTLHWGHATEFGHEIEPGIFVLGYNSNKDDIYTGQSSFVFDENLEKACIDGISEYVGRKLFEIRKPILIKDLFHECISNSTGAEIHFQTMTKQIHSSKNFIVTSKNGGKRRPSKKYEMDDIIEASPQVGLFCVPKVGSKIM